MRPLQSVDGNLFTGVVQALSALVFAVVIGIELKVLGSLLMFLMFTILSACNLLDYYIDKVVMPRVRKEIEGKK